MDRVFQAADLVRHPAIRDVVNHVEALEDQLPITEGVLYYDFPVFRDEQDRLYRAQLLLASRSHGVAVLGVCDLTQRTLDRKVITQLDDDLTQLNRILFGMFLKSRLLGLGLRAIRPNLSSILVMPHLTRGDLGDLEVRSQPAWSLEALTGAVRTLRQEQDLTPPEWAELRAILEGAKGLIRPKERDVPPGRPNGKGAILAELEQEIANFDLDQRRAALTIVQGPQRIRGLAGSGKTIVLAYKAAHLHLRDPSATILFTFYTKSLYDFVRRLITRFYRHFVDRDPDWERVHVRHAWGGRNIDGVYYSACLENGVRPMTLSQARNAGADNYFAYVCQNLLDSGRVGQKYEYVLMDEAQDYPTAFYRLCFALTRGPANDRNVVWAYDELQNIFDVKLQSTRDVFGLDEQRSPLMDLDRASEASGGYAIHDIVLRRCYRNAREVLITAHALGFGVYSDTIVQMLEGREHWEDVGYAIEEGECQPGQRVVILRPQENSPLTISNRQEKGELVRCYVAAQFAEEVAWIREQVQLFLQDGLRPEEIMVICLDDRSARVYFQALTADLTEAGLTVNNVLTNPYTESSFIREGAITLTTVHRAKGNEAPVVFAAGIDALLPGRKSRIGRNRIFTAFTRAKAWLRVSGVGEGARYFANEIAVALENSPRLRFVYPDPRQVETLQRDLSDKFAELETIYRRLEQLDLMEEFEAMARTRAAKPPK